MGAEREASLFLIRYERIGTGDYVLVHLGHAIEKITPDEAQSAWQIHDEMLSESGR